MISKLQYENQLILSSLSDFRGYCNLFFESTKEEIENYFNEDLVVKQTYNAIKKDFDPQIVIKLYNDSVFLITSLTGRH